MRDEMGRVRRAAAALAILAPLLLPAAQATAEPAAGAPEAARGGIASRIVDGDTLVLASGAQIRLVGIQAPKLPLGRPGFTAWPLAAEAKQALGLLALGKRLRLSYGSRRIDRHGRLLAHLHDLSGTWIQGRLLAAGMARVYTFPDNRHRAADMLALEVQARTARRGLWGKPYYRILRHHETARFINTFQLVEGRVHKTAVVRGRAYLNFGADWKTDFTVTISPRNMRRFKRDWIRLETLEGARIRVRGWLKSYNGPMIEATHPEQIELLAP